MKLLNNSNSVKIVGTSLNSDLSSFFNATYKSFTNHNGVMNFEEVDIVVNGNLVINGANYCTTLVDQVNNTTCEISFLDSIKEQSVLIKITQINFYTSGHLVKEEISDIVPNDWANYRNHINYKDVESTLKEYVETIEADNFEFSNGSYHQNQTFQLILVILTTLFLILIFPIISWVKTRHLKRTF